MSKDIEIPGLKANEQIYGSRETYKFKFQEQDGVPVDLTDLTVLVTVKRVSDDDPFDTQAIIRKEIDTFTDAENGEGEYTIDEVDSANKPGRYFKDYKVVDSDGIVQFMVSRFEWFILASVTNRTEEAPTPTPTPT